MVALATVPLAPVAPAVFIGMQSGCGVVDDIALYNLTTPIPGHPEGSTVSAQTLLAAGYRLPERVVSRPTALPAAGNCPAAQCWREVVPHPAGGWTVACPVDATQSSVRIFKGCWPKRQQAVEAMESLV